MESAMYDLLYIIELLSSVLFKIGIIVLLTIYLRRIKTSKLTEYENIMKELNND